MAISVRNILMLIAYEIYTTGNSRREKIINNIARRANAEKSMELRHFRRYNHKWNSSNSSHKLLCYRNICWLNVRLKPLFIRFTIPWFHATEPFYIRTFVYMLRSRLCLSFVCFSPSFYNNILCWMSYGIPGKAKYSLNARERENYYDYHTKDSRTVCIS